MPSDGTTPCPTQTAVVPSKPGDKWLASLLVKLKFYSQQNFFKHLWGELNTINLPLSGSFNTNQWFKPYSVIIATIKNTTSYSAYWSKFTYYP